MKLSAALLSLVTILLMKDEVGASLDAIVGYTPETVVTDQNAIDRDLAMMEQTMVVNNEQSFTRAKRIYTEGVHSATFAKLTLDQGAASVIEAGSAVRGPREDGKVVELGTVMEEVAQGGRDLMVQYNVGSVQRLWSTCYVGALGTMDAAFKDEAETSGCLKDTGAVQIRGKSFPYTYDPFTGNLNGRYMALFSAQSETLSYECQDVGGSCPYDDYAKFFQYYGNTGDYANQWVLGALDKKKVSFGAAGGRGDVDFTNAGDLARIEAVKKGTAYMGLFMETIYSMEAALDVCVTDGDTESNSESLQLWDQAVAYWAGSLEGKGIDGNDAGVLMFRLAKNRCKNFKTCNEFGDGGFGPAFVNVEALRNFLQGQEDIKFGDCEGARNKKESVVNILKVPLIQGTLRYAFRSAEIPSFDNEMSQMEGATFAAAVLPFVHDCNEKDASFIYEQMKFPGGGATDFKGVKRAFEKNYNCMGITCADVGGLYDEGNSMYYTLAEPCNASAGINMKGLGVGLGVIFLLLFLTIWYFFCRPNRGKSFKDNIASGVSYSDDPNDPMDSPRSEPPESAFVNAPIDDSGPSDTPTGGEFS